MVEDIIKEEHRYLLETLLSLTKKDPTIWDCTEFSPVSFLLSQDEDGSTIACIIQCFEFQSMIKQVQFNLGITETIEFKAGVGNIHLSLEKRSPEMYDQIDEFVSCEPKRQSPSEIYNQKPFKDEIITQFSEILIPYALKSDAAISALQWASFNVLKGIPVKFKRNKLFRFGQQLFDTGRFYDFHKSILDLSVRERLMSELSPSE